MGEKWSLNRWLTFEHARDLVRDEGISSVSQYKRWWDFNRPAQIPKYPYNVWKREWTNWNDFLGNNNKFEYGSTVYRPYVDAVRYVHSLNIRSQQMWFKHIRENGMPEDIPRRPELVYRKNWVSWNHWLGNKASARVAIQQHIANDPGLLYIVHLHGRPANVVRIGTIADIGSLKALGPHSVIKIFKMENGYDWKALVGQFGTQWWEDNTEWMISNINELLFELSSDLLYA